jgi:3(or 17)beta-hydroxysteroid dehydrogenase
VTALGRETGARPLQLNVAEEADWEAAADMLRREAPGGLSILVHNAGIGISKPLPDVTLRQWRKTMSINCEGVFLGCRTMEPLLAAAGSKHRPSSVVIISSIAGIVGFPEQADYNTTKGAVRQLSKSLAIEWPKRGRSIRCNSIHPGCIRTPLLDASIAGWIEAGLLPPGSTTDATGALCPLGVVGEPSDIAMGAVYLGSDEARFVTGIELVIDGGIVAA